MRRRHLPTLGDRPRRIQPNRNRVDEHRWPQDHLLLSSASVTVMIMGWSRVIWLCQLLPGLPSTKRGGGWLTLRSPLIRKATVFLGRMLETEPTAD